MIFIWLHGDNPIPDDKILALVKSEALADKNFSVAQQIMHLFFNRTEKIVEKGENKSIMTSFRLFFDPFPHNDTF